MAKKFNMAAAKEFGIVHGEKIVLGVCAFIAISFGIMGLMRAGNAGSADASGKSWSATFREIKVKMERDRDSVQPTPMSEEQEQKLLEKNYGWPERHSEYRSMAYLTQPDSNLGKKRFNPAALPLIADPNLMDLKYLNCGILVHDYNPAMKTINTLSGGVAGMGGDAPMPMAVTPPFGSKKGVGGVRAPVVVGPYSPHDVRPSRMIVGTMVFPLKKLVADYVKALRLEGQFELFANPEDLPHFEGFTLLRFEILPNGEPANKNGDLVIGYDKATKQVQVSAALKRMLRDAVYDEELPTFMEPYLFEGLSMPMPKLANGRYPKPNIPGFDFSAWVDEPVAKWRAGKKPGAKDKGGIKLPGKKADADMPMANEIGAAGKKLGIGADSKIEPVKYKDLVVHDPHLANRLFNTKDPEKDFNVFHSLGFKADALLGADKKPGGVAMPQQMPEGMGAKGAKINETRFFAPWNVLLGDELPPGGEGGAGGVRPMKVGVPNMEVGAGAGGVEFKNWDRDALLRFIDIDVEPGKTYQYAVQVRISNPNYKKTTLVAFNALASNPELPLNQADAWVWSKEVTVPQEYFIYAVDQALLDEMAAFKELKKSQVFVPKDQTAIQVHQWMKYKDDRVTKHAIGDWAIAKRLMVRRGDEIGLGAGVIVPVWKQTKDAFELPMEIRDAKKASQMTPGMRMDLRPVVMEKDKETLLPPPVLVDFSGGRRYKPNGFVEEESATDVLILDSTGKLVLRNSRIDSDAAERDDRIAASRGRVLEIINEMNQAMPAGKGPMGPGAGGREP